MCAKLYLYRVIILKRNISNVFANICSMFVLIILSGVLAMQLADIAIAAQEEMVVSHEGIATVKAIDMNQGIVKLAHGPIASLKWPSMTMNFKIKDRALLQEIKVDNVVTFTFIQSGSDYIVTRIQSSK
ncbi:MAG: copper-binding protein [Nitrosomonas sp.]|nr:copper-binding protein [Nitrosomonas sp.]